MLGEMNLTKPMSLNRLVPLSSSYGVVETDFSVGGFPGDLGFFFYFIFFFMRLTSHMQIALESSPG